MRNIKCGYNAQLQKNVKKIKMHLERKKQERKKKREERGKKEENKGEKGGRKKIKKIKSESTSNLFLSMVLLRSTKGNKKKKLNWESKDKQKKSKKDVDMKSKNWYHMLARYWKQSSADWSLKTK